MKITRDFVIQNLADSGLMSADDASSLCESLSSLSGPADSDTVAQELSGTDKLTAYQAECVCRGETSGLLFGDYVVLEKIGQGGMGVVLKGQHSRMDRIVAIKKLTAAALESEDLVKRFYREVKASARLLHPNVVTALDAREHEGIHYLIMEFIEGEDLSDVLKRQGPLPVDEAVDYVVQAAQGLEFAHKHGVYHRDIKPANLLLDHEGTVKILDMGLARIVSEAKGNEASRDQLTSDDQVMGTCDYMAPEQAENTKGVDHRADIYSLGCTLYRLLTNSPPYTGANLMQLLLAHRESPIPSICDKRPDVPASVDAVFQKMVAKTRDERYQSMTEVIEALQAALGRGSAPAAAPAPDPGLMDFLKQIHDEPSGVSRGGRGSGKTDAAQAAVTVQEKADPITDETVDMSATADTDPSTSTRQPSTPAAPARPKKPAARRRKKQAPMLLLIGVGIGISLIGAAVVAAVLYVQTDYGTVVVKTDDKDIQVLVKRGGQVYVADAKNQWRIEVKSGKYSVELKEGNDRFVLDKDTITVTRGDEVRVRVELKPRPKPPRPAIAPFDTAQAKTHQKEWADYWGLPVERNFELPGGEKLTMVLIPPGEFMMGSTKQEQARFLEDPKAADEGPQLRVRISRPFYLGKYEVTQAQWEAVTGNNPSYWKGPQKPVAHGKRGMIQPFLMKLNTASVEGNEFTLPTEAQWEYACRAGTATAYFCAEDESSIKEYAWFNVNSDGAGAPHSVGQKKANAWGLHDMYGNVSEWCADRYAEDYYARSPMNDPTGPEAGKEHVVRGGHGRSSVKDLRSAKRFRKGEYADAKQGLRLACTIPYAPGTKRALPALGSSPLDDTSVSPDAPRPAIALDEGPPEVKVSGWRLVHSVPFESPAGIAYNPADARLYAIRRAKSYRGGGLYRIDPDGTAVCVARGDKPAAVAVDPDDGDAFVSEDFSGNIFRSPFGETGRSVWVSGLGPGDADPIGMAVAPNDYGGDVIEPGEALVVDRGCNGPDNVWRFSPDEPQEKVVVHKDDGTLINVQDVTIGSRHIYLVDTAGQDGESAPGRIYRLGAGGSLTRVEVSEPIITPNGIATDPISGDLLLLEAGAGRLVRVDPATGTVTTMFTRFRGPAWAGVDVTPDGRRIFVSDSPSNKIYVFEHEKLPDWPLPPDAPKPANAPFDTVQAKEHQQAWAKYLGVPVEREFELPGGEKLTMMLIPPGEFLMGSPEAERRRALDEAKAANAKKTANTKYAMDQIPGEGPLHPVRISRPFYLGKYEVTQAQWQAVMGNNPSQFKDPMTPVESVLWGEIEPFLAKLNTASVKNGMKFTLPTEAQWEYACRAGTATAYGFGDDVLMLGEYGWFEDNSGGKTHPVGEKKANGWGLHDMHGNVCEWCVDWHADDYYNRSPLADPVGPQAERARVNRGGSSEYRPEICRSAFRGACSLWSRYGDLGFRLICKIPYPPETKPAEPATASSNPPSEPKLPPDAPPRATAPADTDEAKTDEPAGAEENTTDGLRTWTDTAGKTVEAAFVKFEDGVVHLRRPDGKVAEVPLEKLSGKDQAYVTEQKERSVSQ